MDVFILTYRGIDYFNQWFKESNYSSTTRFHIVDNGQQTIPENLKHLVIYSTIQNIGCSGGFNLMYNIAFNYMGLDQIIIAQEDGLFNQQMLDEIWSNITSDKIVGGYGFPWKTDRKINFGIFGIHKSLYSCIGDWDENCVFAYYEDNDYEHRINLANKNGLMLNYDGRANCSLTLKIEPNMLNGAARDNEIYMRSKWGTNYSEFAHPFNNPSMSFSELMPIQQTVKDVYGNITEFPSQTEFKRFLAGH